MELISTSLEGLYLIKLDKYLDERGSFTRLFCAHTLFPDVLQAQAIIQSGLSSNKEKGTLRGMHYQLEPQGQDKWIHCMRGKIYDVALDLRKNSKTFGQSFGLILEDIQPSLFYIPKGFAHGFITLEDNTEVLYQMTNSQSLKHERTIRWNDPSFKITWPSDPKVMSQKDRSQKDFNPHYHLAIDHDTEVPLLR